MAYLIGTDEAGYGPNFGPLVVSATVWHIPDDMTHADLYAAVKECITPWPKHLTKPKQPAKKKAAMKFSKKATKTTKKKVAKKRSRRKIRIDDRVWMADSKQLYKPGNTKRGLSALELGVLSAISVSEDNHDGPSDWHDLWQTLCANDHNSMKALPWYRDFDECLPIDITADQATLAAERLADGLAAADVRLCRIRSRAVDAHQFNELLCEYENKAEVLSHVTLGLAAKQIEWIREQADSSKSASSKSAEPIRVLCDKHGGRNHYAALLSYHFPDHFVEVRKESRPISSYGFGTGDERVEFDFQAKADNILAAGLASMTSKYLRELAMRAFNDFWRGHDAELQPTAGYPGDARRFKKQIATIQSNLGIDDHILWRDR